VAWVVYTFLYAPSHTATDNPKDITYVATERVERALTEEMNRALPDQEPRIVKLAGANLDIFLDEAAFEKAVAYPDRAAFFERVGKTWCGSVGEAFLPVVRFRSVRNGHEFGRFSCFS